MRKLFGLLFFGLLFSCHLDNKTYASELVEIKKNKGNFEITLSTNADLKSIQEKYRFPDQRVIGHIKTQSFKEQKVRIKGIFDSKNAKKIGNSYSYQSTVEILPQDSNKQLSEVLTPQDTLEVFLQLGFPDGRTYPTKSVLIPASEIL